MSKIYTGAVRVKITVPTFVDLTLATTHVLLIKKPNGSIAEWSATILGDAMDGTLIYYTVAGDLDFSGLYTGMAKIVTSDGGTYFGETFTFKIYERFK